MVYKVLGLVCDEWCDGLVCDEWCDVIWYGKVWYGKVYGMVNNSTNMRERTFLGFQSPSAFEKASGRRVFLMHADFEILVKSDVECLNGLPKLVL